jgi:hypothetical protein
MSDNCVEPGQILIEHRRDITLAIQGMQLSCQTTPVPFLAEQGKEKLLDSLAKPLTGQIANAMINILKGLRYR